MGGITSATFECPCDEGFYDTEEENVVCECIYFHFFLYRKIIILIL